MQKGGKGTPAAAAITKLALDRAWFEFALKKGADMKSKRSWKWLVPRLVSRYVRNSAGRTRAIARPCLAVENLEERNLLTAASPSFATTIGPPPAPVGEQVVVDLLQGGLKLTVNEIGLLKVIANPPSGPPSTEANAPTVSDIHITKELDKASVALFQLNSTLNKLGQDVIRGQLTDHTLMAAEQKIEYLKIKLEDIIISSLNVSQQDAESIVKPLIDDAENLKIALADLNQTSQLIARKAGKGQQEYVKIDSNILNLEDLALKVEVDSLEGKSTDPGVTEQISLNFAKIKVEYQEQKLDQDPAAVAALDDFQATLFPELSGGGNFEGGVVVPPPNKTTG